MALASFFSVLYLFLILFNFNIEEKYIKSKKTKFPFKNNTKKKRPYNLIPGSPSPFQVTIFLVSTYSSSLPFFLPLAKRSLLLSQKSWLIWQIQQIFQSILCKTKFLEKQPSYSLLLFENIEKTWQMWQKHSLTNVSCFHFCLFLSLNVLFDW